MKIKKVSAYNSGIVPSKKYQLNPSFNEQDENLSNEQVIRSKRNLKQNGKSNDPDSLLSKINLAYDEEGVEDISISLNEEDAELVRNLKKSINRGVGGIFRRLVETPGIPEDQIHVFMDHIRGLTLAGNKLKTASALSSVVYKTANKLERDGVNYGLDELRKIAQESEAPQGQASTEQAPSSAPTEQQPAAQPEAQPEAIADSEPPQNETGIPRTDEVEPARFEDIKTKGPEEGEYDGIVDDDITIGDASAKLDQVAGMLADRRVIRNLAEFDIMLDKLGIASMFPELAESQSKLIDAFGYALTRVTKMMGQLSNAQTIMTSSDSVPGIDESSE